jgi:hypothetical protein
MNELITHYKDQAHTYVQKILISQYEDQAHTYVKKSIPNPNTSLNDVIGP